MSHANSKSDGVLWFYLLSCSPTFMVIVRILWDNTREKLNTGPDMHHSCTIEISQSVPREDREEGPVLLLDTHLLSALFGYQSPGGR